MRLLELGLSELQAACTRWQSGCVGTSEDVFETLSTPAVYLNRFVGSASLLAIIYLVRQLGVLLQACMKAGRGDNASSAKSLAVGRSQQHQVGRELS